MRKCRCECLVCSLFGIVLLLPLPLLAEEPAAEGVPVALPAAEPLAEGGAPQAGFIDAQRDYVSEKFVDFARHVDAFFGSERNFQESNKSVLQFDVGKLIEKGSSNNIALSYRAKFHFPAVQDRLKRYQKQLHLMLESNPDKSQNLTGASVQPGRTSLFREVTAPDTYGAALRFENADDSPWRFSADGGLKLDNIFLRPFVRSRAAYTMPLGVVQLNLAESVFWFDTTGLGESTQLDADHVVSEKLLFRASSGATWLHDRQNFDLRQDFSLYHTQNESASLLYQISAIGLSKPQTQVSEYVALLLYRQRVHRDWVFMEVSPQLHYPRATDFHLNAQLILRLELLFSK